MIFLLAACLDDEVGDVETQQEYVAFRATEDYQALVADDPVGDTHHRPTVVYIDEPPPPRPRVPDRDAHREGGTVTTEGRVRDGETRWRLHPQARNWEWFELTSRADARDRPRGESDLLRLMRQLTARSTSRRLQRVPRIDGRTTTQDRCPARRDRSQRRP